MKGILRYLFAEGNDSLYTLPVQFAGRFFNPHIVGALAVVHGLEKYNTASWRANFAGYHRKVGQGLGRIAGHGELVYYDNSFFCAAVHFSGLNHQSRGDHAVQGGFKGPVPGSDGFKLFFVYFSRIYRVFKHAFYKLKPVFTVYFKVSPFPGLYSSGAYCYELGSRFGGGQQFHAHNRVVFIAFPAHVYNQFG